MKCVEVMSVQSPVVYRDAIFQTKMGDAQQCKSSNQFKKNVGKIILKLNSEILELQNERGPEATATTVKVQSTIANIEKCHQALSKSLHNLKDKPDFIARNNLEKTVQLIELNIDTAKRVLGEDGDVEKIREEDIEKSKEEASKTIREVEDSEKGSENELEVLLAQVAETHVTKQTNPEEAGETIDDAIKAELEGIGKYKSDRVKKMKKEIEEKMSYHKKELLKKWSAQKEVLDYQALKEFRSDFEMSHRTLRNMVNEWDRRKISDILSDYLTDIIDHYYDDYMVEFRRMDEEKRMEAAVIRKRNIELEEYRKEKRRNIPTWPKSMTYSKFKPDLLSWDKEHHLTSGSVKFGLLAEMLKSQERVTTYEQIQTRLGKERNDEDIIKKVVELLDGINEETIYNKLAFAWEEIISIKKKKDEGLNDFFSRFETLLYSLNLADDKYKDLEEIKDGKDFKYYKERENMIEIKVEMNDKLKAVHLLRALDIEESFKRDILSKVDFSKTPKNVFEDVKTAIRDICGDGKSIKTDNQVLIMKPWQGEQEGGARRSTFRTSRSRSSSQRRNGRQFSPRESRGGGYARRGRDRSRDYSRDRDRSWSRGRRRSSQVEFKDRREERRDPTPAPGRANTVLVTCNTPYDEIYETEKIFRNKNNSGQVIIVDSGCPRSLMGKSEFKLLKRNFAFGTKDIKPERFKFGPSKIYNSVRKVQLKINLDGVMKVIDFFVIDGEVPILLGNDVLAPLKANIDIGSRKLEFKSLGAEIGMVKTAGGHFVIPVKDVVMDLQEENFKNENKSGFVRGAEADEVMHALYEAVETDEDCQKLHDEVGHKVFVNLTLNKDEEGEVLKVHRYFGHRSARKTWEMFAKANRLKGKRKAVMEIIDKCKICSKFRKSPPRPKVGMPVSNNFNQIVSMDLKVLPNKKGYILWLVDTFSKLIKGRFIPDKNPETVIQAIIDAWIVGDGSGPGHPTFSFYSDNGGEFLNEATLDFAAKMDIKIKMTAAEAPWQNGICERNHASADVIIDKILLEKPEMKIQDVINQAAFARNCDVNKTRFSALQLMTGLNPYFPGLGDANVANSNFDSSSKYMKTLKNIDEVRVKFREVDCNDKLKKAFGERMNNNVEKQYEMGESLFFFDDKKKEWKKGTALIRLGKTLYLKYGNFLRRVAIDKVRPDANGEIDGKETDLGQEETDEESKRFLERETPVVEMAPELDLASKCSQLAAKVKELENQLENMVQKEEGRAEIDGKEKELLDKEKTENTVKQVMQDEQGEKEELQLKRRLKRQKQKEKKIQNPIDLPKVGEEILFKNKNESDWHSAKVVKTFKKNSIYKNYRHLKLENGDVIEKNIVEEVEWCRPDKEEDCETFLMQEIAEKNSYPVTLVPREEWKNPEIIEAMESEINKFKDFEAVKEVRDEGQYRIPIRWVVTEKGDDGKGQRFKARLCMRGDKELDKELIRSDSPTVAKESIKIALTIAANEKFKIKCGDIKSAYLQGNDMDREIFVKPPEEAKAGNNLWQLVKGAYGIMDGGRLFYLKLRETLKNLGMHEVHSDGAVFSYVKKGKLHGLIISNVDDLLMIGDEVFDLEVTENLREEFKFSKMEEGTFVYCGCKIKVNEDGTIDLDQSEYIDNLKKMEKAEGDDERELTGKEKTEARGKVGALLWISLITRPDISFDVNSLSCEVSKGKVKTVKEINRVISIAKENKNRLKFVPLGDLNDLKVSVYADASFSNVGEPMKTISGRVILIENKKDKKVNVISWKSKKISRVCRSIKAAETRALDEALDEGVHVARIIKEIYEGHIDLKKPAQIPVEAFTDNKSLWESIHNTRQCEEKLLRNTIAGMKELIDMKMVDSVRWVPTKKQLADCLTKKTKKGDWLLDVIGSNVM